MIQVKGVQKLLALSGSVAIAVLILSGCGGGGSGSASTANADSASNPENQTAGRTEPLEPSPLSKAEYIEQAEAICVTGNEELLGPILTYMRKHSKPHQSEDELTADAIHAVYVPNLQVQIDELRDLGAPAGDEKQIEAFLDAMLQATERLESRDELSLEGDLERELQKAGELALDYGIANCAN